MGGTVGVGAGGGGARYWLMVGLCGMPWAIARIGQKQSNRVIENNPNFGRLKYIISLSKVSSHAFNTSKLNHNKLKSGLKLIPIPVQHLSV